MIKVPSYVIAPCYVDTVDKLKAEQEEEEIQINTDDDERAHHRVHSTLEPLEVRSETMSDSVCSTLDFSRWR